MQNTLTRPDSKNEASINLSEAHDLLVKSAKIGSLVGGICGFVYLLSYTTHVGIPFPLELSVLPATLLIVGLTSIVGTFIVIAGMFIPAITLEYNDEVTKGYRNAEEIQTDVLKVRITRYFLCTWVPTASALVGIFLLIGAMGNAAWLKLAGALLIFVSAGWIFYTPKYVGIFLEKRWQYSFVNFAQIALSIFAYSLIVIITLAVFPELGKWSAWSGCSIALIIFTLFQIVVFVPTSPSRNGKILLPPNFKHEATPTMGAAFALAVVWTAMTVFMPQVNYKIGGAALRAFHVGGNIPVAICLKAKPATIISQRISFDSEYCSEKLSMKLDSGDRVYVSKLVAGTGLDSQTDDAQLDSVYFRQDEIKQKIYFSSKK